MITRGFYPVGIAHYPLPESHPLGAVSPCRGDGHPAAARTMDKDVAEEAVASGEASRVFVSIPAVVQFGEASSG